jgi:hypothetical protein
MLYDEFIHATPTGQESATTSVIPYHVNQLHLAASKSRDMLHRILDPVRPAATGKHSAGRPATPQAGPPNVLTPQAMWSALGVSLVGPLSRLQGPNPPPAVLLSRLEAVAVIRRHVQHAARLLLPRYARMAELLSLAAMNLATDCGVEPHGGSCQQTAYFTIQDVYTQIHDEMVHGAGGWVAMLEYLKPHCTPSLSFP